MKVQIIDAEPAKTRPIVVISATSDDALSSKRLITGGASGAT
jgi:hypothetical protein